MRSLFRLTAILINVIRNETGKQKHARMERVERTKRKIISRNSGTKYKSTLQTPNNVAMIPIRASEANEIIPVLVMT